MHRAGQAGERPGSGDIPVAGVRREGGAPERRGERGKAVRALSAEDQLASITDFI